MRSLFPALLCALVLAPLGCNPPAQPASTRPQERNSQERSSDARSDRRSDSRDNREAYRGSDSRDNDRYERRDREDRGSRDTEDNQQSRSNQQSSGGNRPPRARPATAAPGTFDFYLLTLSWSPEFCTTHPQAAECATHAGFILHGLWPQNTNATYPEKCSNAPGPANPAQYSDIFPDPGLLEHEWTTHGTCSGLAPDAYFQLARRAFQSIHTPADLNNLTQQTSEPPATILGEFSSINPSVPQSSLALSCGNNYLTAVQVCLDKTLNAFACQVRTCGANTVRIVPRNGSSSN